MDLLKWMEKNPVEAAALGTAAYFTGGAALGAGATGAAAPGAAGLTAAEYASAFGTPAAASSGGGLLGTLGSVGQAAGAASSVKGLLGGDSQPVQGQPLQSNGGQPLTQLYNSIQQSQKQSSDDEMRKRNSLYHFAGGYQ